MDWKNIWAHLARFRPSLADELGYAGFDVGVLEYLGGCFSSSSLLGLLAFAGSHLVFSAFGRQNIFLSSALGLSGFVFSCAFALSRPRLVLGLRAYGVEQHLVFALHALNIELGSGRTFSQALSSISERDYGAFSRECVFILSYGRRHGLEKALSLSAKRVPSRYYRRFIWQVSNSLKTGADINASVKAVVEDLRRRQERTALRYARGLEKKLTFYIMGGIVFPALSVVILQTVSSLGIGADDISEKTYVFVFVFSLFFQLLFLAIIRFTKPSLLGKANPGDAGFSLSLAHLIQVARHAGFNDPGRALAAGFVLCLLLAGFFSAVLASSVGFAAGFLLSFAFAFVSFYTYLIYLGDRRGTVALSHLPDCLRVIAANLEAGLPIDKSLFYGARDDLPVLGFEVKRVASDVMKGKSFEAALEGLKSRVKSDALHMSVNLIQHGLRAGSGVSAALFHVADVIQDRETVRGEVWAHLHAVKTTILVLIVFSAPLLYGSSMVASEVLGSFNDRVSGFLSDDLLGMGFFKPKAASVSAGFLESFITASLFTSSVLGCMIVGELQSGRARDGLKYLFFTFCFSQLIYVLSRAVILSHLSEVMSW